MRGIRAKDMLAIVDYIYSGETKVDQENIDGFLSLAVKLKLKGLAKAGTEDITLDNVDDRTKRAGQKPIVKQEHNYQIDKDDANYGFTPNKVANNSKVPVDMDKWGNCKCVNYKCVNLKDVKV